MKRIYKVIEKIFMRLSGLAFKIKKIDSKKFIPCIVFVSCMTISVFWGEDILKEIEVLDADVYNTLINLIPGAAEFLSSTFGKIVVGISAVTAILSVILRVFYKKPALLIRHTTMGHDLSIIEDNYKNEYYSKKVDMTKISIPKTADDDSIVTAIEDIDTKYSTYKDTAFSQIFYYGVSHIPLVFRFGYLFGQSKKIKFLHRFRKNENDQEFKILPECEGRYPIAFGDRLDEENIQGTHDELIVAISTTYPIKNVDMDIIDKDNTMLRYIFEADPLTLGFDFFSSVEKMESYTNRFVSDIRRLIKDYNISTVHILISSSVPFTFYFAQQLNTQQFPKLVVYQYENQKYNWGINITENDPRKAIIRLDK